MQNVCDNLKSRTSNKAEVLMHIDKNYWVTIIFEFVSTDLPTCTNLVKLQASHHGGVPYGSIVYISNGWGSRASEVYITKHSGLLSKLLPGDVILADREFTIQERMLESIVQK